MPAPPIGAAGPHAHVNGVSKFSAIQTLLFGYLELGSLGAEISSRPPAPTAWVHTPLQSHRHS